MPMTPIVVSRGSFTYDPTSIVYHIAEETIAAGDEITVHPITERALRLRDGNTRYGVAIYPARIGEPVNVARRFTMMLDRTPTAT